MESRTLYVRRTPGSKVQGADDDDEEAPAEPPGSGSIHPLSPLVRLYIYALHGCLCEVVFTAFCDWYETQDRRMAGQSSLWALPMYATAIYLMEQLRATLLDQCYPLPVRLIAYTLLIYLWEFSWGAGLSLLGACPWDYSGYRYNLRGLVTLEYALPWAVASLIAEKHVIRNTLRIRMEN
ncbi:transmembrane protein 229B-like [Polymixia lowei]